MEKNRVQAKRKTAASMNRSRQKIHAPSVESIVFSIRFNVEA